MIVTWACLLLSAIDADAPPVVRRAEPAPEWDAKFVGSEGWIGGDGVYSAPLGRDRVLWLFGDSFVGSVKDGRRVGAVMVNNAVAVQAGRGAEASLRFITGKTTDGKPSAIFTPTDAQGFFWPQAAVVRGGRLVVFLAHIEKAGAPGPFGFKHVGERLAVIEYPGDEPEKWRAKPVELPFAEFGAKRERSWGSAVLAAGDSLYVFGYDEAKGGGLGRRELIVARAPADKPEDFKAWRFRTADGWSEKPEESAVLAGGLATEFSVSRRPGGKGLVLVYTENGIGGRVVARFAAAPEGPWSEPVLLFTCPEAKEKGLFCYAAKAHPWAAGADELLVSYCVNAHDFGRIVRDASVYRPKFVRVKFVP
jgi:hypothetical protein